MYFELKENKPHGTSENPFSLYHIHNVTYAFQIPVHWHDELEIIYIRDGSLNVNISGENYVGKTGDSYVVSPGELHFMGSDSLDADYYTFLFPLEFVSFQSNDLYEQMILEPLRSRSMMFCTEAGNHAKELCERLLLLHAGEGEVRMPAKAVDLRDPEQRRESLRTQMETKAVLLAFVQCMWENGYIVENHISGGNVTEKEMINYLRQNYTNEISLNAFGAEFHLSEKYISRYFKDHFHITLSQYVNHLRLEHAKQLLRETQLPVTEVALQSGYQNVSYFIRCFKRQQ